MPVPFFSIIIPTLNEEKYLPALLDDLRAQSFQDFEVIVVDGKSEDRTPQIVHPYTLQGAYRCIESDRRNVGFQRNLGANTSQGKYLFFCDADNRLPVYYLEGVHYRLMQKPHRLATTLVLPDSADKRDALFVESANLLLSTGSVLKFPLLVMGACLFIERALFDQTQGFDPEIHYAEDYNYVRKLMEAGHEFAVLKDPKFVVSLRRFRQENTLDMYRKLLPTVLKIWLRNEKVTSPLESYPMLGGADLALKEAEFGKRQSFWELKSLLKQLSEMTELHRSVVQKIVRRLNNTLKTSE